MNPNIIAEESRHSDTDTSRVGIIICASADEVVALNHNLPGDHSIVVNHALAIQPDVDVRRQHI